MEPFFYNQNYPFFLNQNVQVYWPSACCYNQQMFNCTSYFHQPEYFEFDYLIGQNIYNSASLTGTRSVKSLINYDNFDYKQQTRKLYSGNGSSLISNLNKTNSIISYDDEKIRTIYDVFRKSKNTSESKNFLGWKPEERQPFKWINYSDSHKQVKQIGSALIKMGLRKGGFVGIFAKNRPEWVLTDLACASYSFISVPLYETFGPEAVPFILKQTEMNIVFCEDSIKAALLLNSKSTTLKIIVVFESKIDNEIKELAKKSNVLLMNFDYLKNVGKMNLVEVNPPKPDDIYTICYTSGTTGLPKGVVLTHANMVSTLTAASLLFKKGVELVDGEEVYLSYLPLAHMMERIAQAYMISISGSIGFFKGDITELPVYLQEIKPTFFLTVPRLLNKFKAQIEFMSKTLPADKQMMFKKAFMLKKQEIEKGLFNFNSPLDAAFSQIKNLFGGSVKLMVVGSAPISSEVFDFFKVVLGCHLIEGYGATETCGAASAQVPGDSTIGHVGSPLVNCRIKLADVPEMGLVAERDNKGEILVKGSNIFKGYYKDPKKTKEVLDKDGWYHTGDIGVINQNGCLKIVDRIKNIFKLQQGEYIAPEKIESAYLACDFIAQIYVHGNSLKSNLVAVVVLNDAALIAWAKNKGLEYNIKDLSRNPILKTDILATMENVANLKGLKGFEKVKDIFIHSEPFSIQNGLLTPTFKPKRTELMKYFEKEINHMYQNLD
ncbi:unnamed protein product [Brachionus calyciflorus]|uniref:long-chain-fatty-acid--CoA ligase n=1 Tax=Brachionus calyciflorus TaxID=104777 RepID=A0A813M9Y4_9BILA|nr:unnamed protein product [Brachionus calyciflorus]